MASPLARHRNQSNRTGAYDDLARMFKIHRDPVANRRLHLTKPPIGAVGMAYQIAGFKCLWHRQPLKGKHRVSRSTGPERIDRIAYLPRPDKPFGGDQQRA